MEKVPNSEGLLNNVNQILTEEGSEDTNQYTDSLDILEKLILPGLKNSKNTMSSLYKYTPPQKGGILGKFKGMILIRLRNIVLNVVEAESMKQHKFNELTYKAIEELTAELKKGN